MHLSVAAALLVLLNLSCSGPGSSAAGSSGHGSPGAGATGQGSPAAGSSAAPSAPAPSRDAAPAVVPDGVPRVLLAGNISCLGRPRGEHVFREADAFATWWSATTCGRRETPVVDFASEMVLGVEDADASNGCHGLRIPRVEVRSGALHVSVERRVPGPDEMCTQQVVRPVAAVAVPRREADVVFEWRLQAGP